MSDCSSISGTTLCKDPGFYVRFMTVNKKEIPTRNNCSGKPSTNVSIPPLLVIRMSSTHDSEHEISRSATGVRLEAMFDQHQRGNAPFALSQASLTRVVSNGDHST